MDKTFFAQPVDVSPWNSLVLYTNKVEVIPSAELILPDRAVCEVVTYLGEMEYVMWGELDFSFDPKQEFALVSDALQLELYIYEWLRAFSPSPAVAMTANHIAETLIAEVA